MKSHRQKKLDIAFGKIRRGEITKKELEAKTAINMRDLIKALDTVVGNENQIDFHMSMQTDCHTSDGKSKIKKNFYEIRNFIQCYQSADNIDICPTFFFQNENEFCAFQFGKTPVSVKTRKRLHTGEISVLDLPINVLNVDMEEESLKYAINFQGTNPDKLVELKNALAPIIYGKLSKNGIIKKHEPRLAPNAIKNNLLGE